MVTTAVTTAVRTMMVRKTLEFWTDGRKARCGDRMWGVWSECNWRDGYWGSHWGDSRLCCPVMCGLLFMYMHWFFFVPIRLSLSRKVPCRARRRLLQTTWDGAGYAACALGE